MPVTTIRPEPEVAGSNRLPVLAATINEHLEAAEAATRRGLEHAIAAGALLIEAKEHPLVAHGKWLPWLKANCRGLSTRQAQIYMRLARNRHKLTALKNAPDSHLTIAAAVALVGKPKPERPPGLPGQLDFLGGPEVPLSTPTPTELERTDRKAAFLERCEQAIGSATYSGRLDEEVADAAERAAAAWDRKARELRGKVQDALAFDATMATAAAGTEDGCCRWVKDDGGRKGSGIAGAPRRKDEVGDCVTRAIAIATGKPYREVHEQANSPHPSPSCRCD